MMSQVWLETSSGWNRKEDETVTKMVLYLQLIVSKHEFLAFVIINWLTSKTVH